MMFRTAVILLGFLPANCQSEDPRIAEAEAVAEQTCACNYLACALEAAAPLTDIRGLEQEDFATLPADLISRYSTAVMRTQACVQRNILE